MTITRRLLLSLLGLWPFRHIRAQLALPAATAFSSTANDVLQRFFGLTTVEQNAIAQFVDGQVALGNWQLLDSFQCYALAGTTNPLTDWKAGSSGNPVIAGLVGEPRKICDGYFFPRIADHIDTRISPASLANYSAVNGAIWCRTGLYANTGIFHALLGCKDGDSVARLRFDDTNSALQTHINSLGGCLASITLSGLATIMMAG